MSYRPSTRGMGCSPPRPVTREGRVDGRPVDRRLAGKGAYTVRPFDSGVTP